MPDLTFILKQVELHPQEAHGFAERVGSRALLLWTQLQNLWDKTEKKQVMH